MADLKLGSLVAEIFVEGGLRPHYGTRDSVTGKVFLEYKRYTTHFKSTKATPETAMLFVPLKLEVFLRGKTKIIIKQERDMPADHGGPLFLRSVQIYNGSFTSKAEEKHEFPFSITFPESVAGESLPPSFSYAFQEFPDTIDLAVRYRLGVRFEIPGIDIKTIVPEHDKQPEIRYDLPRPSIMTLNTKIGIHAQKSVVRTQMLLPEDQRPQGFQQRFRAIFQTFPKFGCEISCSGLQHLWAGYQPSFNISIRRSEQESDAVAFPEAIITTFRADLIAYTWCDASKRLKGPFERIDRRTVQKLECRNTLPVALTKATEYTANLRTDEVGKWGSAFRQSGIVRRYFVKVRMKLKVAKEVVGFVREFEVGMVSRPRDWEEDGGGEGSSSRDLAPPPPYRGAGSEAHAD